MSSLPKTEARMATYRLGFLGLDQIIAKNPAGQPVDIRDADASVGLGAHDIQFHMTHAADLKSVLVEVEDCAADGIAADQPGHGQRGQVCAGSGSGRPGDGVELAWRITVRTNEAPGREIDLHGLRIGGRVVGLVTRVGLDPRLRYTVIGIASPVGTVELRQFANGGTAEGAMASAMGIADGRATPEPGPDLWEPVFCLTFGTLVETPDGPRLIEHLKPGDLVSTMDNGSQPLRWAGSRHVTSDELAKRTALRPVEIAARVIGNHRPLLVSPRHRILLNDWRAQVYFGEDEVLVPAQALVNGETVRKIVPEGGVTYVHLLFDRHEVIVSNGALSESFHPGADGLGGLVPVHRQEVEALFPGQTLERRRAAFPIVRMAEARALRLPA
jgi:hypothetical protein